MRLVVLCLGGASAFGLLALPCLAQPAPDPAISASDPAAATPVVALHDPAPAIAPLTLRARARYTADRAFSPENFALGIFTSGIQTWRDRPEAWGRDWEGFAQRFGMRMSRSFLSNGIEFGVGAAIGADPRYRRLGRGSVGSRVRYALGGSFYHYDAQGRRVPALSRFAGIAGSNIIVNHWMPPGDDRKQDILRRCGQQVAWHIGWNVFREFLPDIKRKLGR